jgi:hypothetical protein
VVNFVLNLEWNAGYFFGLLPSDFFRISDFAPSEFPNTHSGEDLNRYLPQERETFSIQA